jgi:hypothetical protein
LKGFNARLHKVYSLESYERAPPSIPTISDLKLRISVEGNGGRLSLEIIDAVRVWRRIMLCACSRARVSLSEGRVGEVIFEGVGGWDEIGITHANVRCFSHAAV